jgi:ribosome-binding protein aMBF1 (putative translation factor)
MGDVNNQDWEPVTWRNAPSKKDQINKGNCKKVSKYNGGKNRQTESVDASKYEGDDSPAQKKPTLSISRLIQQTRLERNMTRKQLATFCNITEAILGDYENGKIAIPENHKNIIQRRLGLTSFKKKKQSK